MLSHINEAFVAGADILLNYRNLLSRCNRSRLLTRPRVWNYYGTSAISFLESLAGEVRPLAHARDFVLLEAARKVRKCAL